jgi:DNA-binding CsgD family transcriptional regulator
MDSAIMTPHEGDQAGDAVPGADAGPALDPAFDDRLLTTLERLLGIRATSLEATLDEASNLINAALDVDKVDVFIYDPGSESLVALGTSDTPMGRRQREIGLDRLPLVSGGRSAEVFQTGEPFTTGRADLDPIELRGLVDSLGVRSVLLCPIEVDGERRGVLSAVSPKPELFADRDLAFLTAASSWVGMVMHRAELMEQVARESVQQGRRQAAEELARLTPRERDVAVLITEGLTNAEIGERLVLVPGTVANYVERILRKLTLRGRAQIAAWAVEHGLARSTNDEPEPLAAPAKGVSRSA